jgi:hypothetical protein
MSLSTIADVWAIKIYSCYLLSTPSYIIVACFHALNRQFAKIITPMLANRAPTRTSTTASTTRLAETRFSCDSNDVSSGRCHFVKVSDRPLEVGYLYHTYRYYFSNKVKKAKTTFGLKNTGWIAHKPFNLSRSRHGVLQSTMFVQSSDNPVNRFFRSTIFGPCRFQLRGVCFARKRLSGAKLQSKIGFSSCGPQNNLFMGLSEDWTSNFDCKTVCTVGRDSPAPGNP